MKQKITVLARCGRYALLERTREGDAERECIPDKYIVACGYDIKDGGWNQGYYFSKRSNAQKEFTELSTYACADCKHVDDNCVICKI